MEELTRQEFYSRILSNIRFSQALNVIAILVAFFLVKDRSNIVCITILNLAFLVLVMLVTRAELNPKEKNIYHLFVLIARAMLIANLFILSKYDLGILIVCITIWISTYPISIINHFKSIKNKNDIRVYNRMRVCIALFIVIACVVQLYSKLYMSTFCLVICPIWYCIIILYIYQDPGKKYNTSRMIDMTEGCTSLIWNIMNLIFH